jgi:hypothetical protein
MGNIFNQDFQEFLLALNEKKVSYFLIENLEWEPSGSSKNR